MTIQEKLLALQWAQLKHDETYHRDVVILPLGQRIKHMALHNTKYTSYLLEAIETGDQRRLDKILTDAFIISLASANTLNQDLGRELGEVAEGVSSLDVLGARLATSLPRDDANPLWLVRAFVRHNGQLSKVCESLDHLESVPFRDTMKSCNLSLLQVLLAEASARGLNLGEAYNIRIREVETRSIFDQRFRAGAGGEA